MKAKRSFGQKSKQNKVTDKRTRKIYVHHIPNEEYVYVAPMSVWQLTRSYDEYYGYSGFDEYPDVA